MTLLEDLLKDIIDKILIRLPPKEVGCCRVVAMSRGKLTSKPALELSSLGSVADNFLRTFPSRARSDK